MNGKRITALLDEQFLINDAMVEATTFILEGNNNPKYLPKKFINYDSNNHYCRDCINFVYYCNDKKSKILNWIFTQQKVYLQNCDSCI